MKDILLGFLTIFINGSLLVGSIFVGSKAWNLFVNMRGGLDFFAYIGWLVLFLVLISLLNMEKW